MKIISQKKDILDVGGGIKFGKGMSKYAGLLANTNYKTFDIVPAYKPDILGDIHNIPLPDASFDAVMCKAVLEHVYDPKKAVDEIYRILRPDGIVFLYVPFLYPYHAHKDYQDYYRYSKDGIKYLLKNFRNIEICPVRGFWETWFYFLPFRLNRVFAPTLGRFLDKVRRQSGNQASGYNVFAIK